MRYRPTFYTPIHARHSLLPVDCASPSGAEHETSTDPPPRTPSAQGLEDGSLRSKGSIGTRKRAAVMAQTLQQLKADVNSAFVATTAVTSTAPGGGNVPRNLSGPALSQGPADSSLDQPPEIGLLQEGAVEQIGDVPSPTAGPPVPMNVLATNSVVALDASATLAGGALVYPPEERRRIRSSWARLMRWSRSLRSREAAAADARARLEKVVVFGGGSFGTAMGVALARQHPALQVSLLLRDAYLCRDINEKHRNSRYLAEWELPSNVTATTSAAEAIAGAQYAIHAVPVQHTRAFLEGIRDLLPPQVPIISVSKGVEVATGQLMSDLIPSALGRKQPAVFLSGPSFAKEVMAQRPTGLVAASKDRALGREIQALFASPTMRVNTSSDVVGVEICGALKNVLAIAAGIVEGLDLGHNAMAALVAQGCAEIRWLAEKMGARPETIAGLSGLGDIMLTCYGSLSRNRSVGVRLGKGEALAHILASSSQVAEGVATAGVVVGLARRYRVQLPVLTAVAQVLNGHISAAEAVAAIMGLPQVEER